MASWGSSCQRARLHRVVTADLADPDLDQRRLLGAAALLHRVAAVLELAAAGQLVEARHHAADLLEAAARLVAAVARHRAEQPRRVVVARLAEQIDRTGPLDHPAGV